MARRANRTRSFCAGVGKSCLLLQFTDKRFQPVHDLTIGARPTRPSWRRTAIGAGGAGWSGVLARPPSRKPGRGPGGGVFASDRSAKRGPATRDRRRVWRADDLHRQQTNQAADLGHGARPRPRFARGSARRGLRLLPAARLGGVFACAGAGLTRRVVAGRPRVLPVHHALVLPRGSRRAFSLRHHPVRPRARSARRVPGGAGAPQGSRGGASAGSSP